MKRPLTRAKNGCFIVGITGAILLTATALGSTVFPGLIVINRAVVLDPLEFAIGFMLLGGVFEAANVLLFRGRR